MILVVALQMLSITLTTLEYSGVGGDGNDCFCRQLHRSELAQLWVSELAIAVIFLNDGGPQVGASLLHWPVW